MAIDNNGLVWLTSIGGDGLYHYTGSEFLKVALKEYGFTDSTSLATTALTSLEIDAENNLWIGTRGYGIEYYDVVANQFRHFTYDSLKPNTLCNDTVTDVLLDRNQNLWVGTSNGLSVKRNGTDSFENHFPLHSISNLYEDPDGNIWVSFGTPRSIFNPGGIAYYDYSEKSFENLISPDSSFYSFGNVLVDGDSTWVAIEEKGIALLNLQERSLSFPAALTTDTLQARDFFNTILFKDEDANLWFGTYGGGLKLYNSKLDSITNEYGEYFDGYFNQLVHKSGSKLESHVTSYLYEPDYDIYWIGTTEGVYAVKKPNQFNLPFFTIPYSEANSMFLHRNVLLIATSDRGLVQKNLTTGETRIWNNQDEADFTIAGLATVFGLRVDKLTQTIWLGSFTHGLFKIDYSELSDFPFLEPLKIVNYRHNPNNEKSLIDNNINGMILDREGLLWMATDGGLSSLDPLSEEFTNYTFNTPLGRNQIDNSIICVEEGFGGDIWVGGDQGISLLDKTTGNFKSYPIGSVNDICVDHYGAVWAGNRSGLFYYDKQAQDFVRLTKEAIGIELRNVIGIQEDWENNLWVTTKYDIVRIEESRSSALVFGEEQGVTFNRMGWQDNHLSYDEEIFIGHHNGYYYFDPKTYESLEISEPILNLSTLKIGNEIVTPEQGSILEDALDKTNAIYLNHDQNTFSVEFTGVDYFFNKTPDFTFILEGYNAEWTDLGNDNQVFFFQVPPDEYTLKIMATNEAGLVARRELEIVIDRPWWLKAWAVLVYIFAFCTLIIVIDRVQRRRTLLKERERVKDRRLAQALEIEQAYKKLRETQDQLIHSEKMASLGELTAGIAHEIQNPLNFVNNFSELNKELIDEQMEELEKGDLEEVKSIAQDIRDNEGKILHHGKRAEDIVRGMLQHSRGGEGEKELTDINTLADEYLRLAYHGLRAKDKSFNADFQCSLDEELPEVEVVPQDIGRVLLNLINNAFQAVSEKAKASKNGFSPTVEVITRNHTDQVEIIVKDNGGGIPIEIQDKIFQPFFTTKATGQGTGLGLSMSYDIVTKGHGGNIRVASDAGYGTSFHVEIPVNR